MSTINFISVHKQVLARFQMMYHISTHSIFQQFDLVILNERNQNFNSLVDTKHTEGVSQLTQTTLQRKRRQLTMTGRAQFLSTLDAAISSVSLRVLFNTKIPLQKMNNNCFKNVLHTFNLQIPEDFKES